MEVLFFFLTIYCTVLIILFMTSLFHLWPPRRFGSSIVSELYLEVFWPIVFQVVVRLYT